MRKLTVAILVFFVFSFFIACANLSSADDYILYDVNNDGVISVADARIAFRASVGLIDLTVIQAAAADIDLDSYVSPADARYILGYIINQNDFASVNNDHTVQLTEQYSDVAFEASDMLPVTELNTEPSAADFTQTESANAVTDSLSEEEVSGDYITDYHDDSVKTESYTAVNSKDITARINTTAVLTENTTKRNEITTETETVQRHESTQQETTGSGGISINQYDNPSFFAASDTVFISFGDTVEAVVSVMGTAQEILSESVAGKTVVSYVYLSDYNILTVFQFCSGRLTGLMTFNSDFEIVCNGISVSMSNIYDSEITSVLKKEDYSVTIYKDTFEGKRIYAYYINNTYNYSFSKINDLYVQEQLCFHFTNALRSMSGVSALQYSQQAATAAKLHSTDMAGNNYFNHVSLSGADLNARLDAQSIDYMVSGENICRNYNNAFDGTDGLFNSASHRKTMLSDILKYIGVGCAKSSSGFGYITQNFYSLVY